MLMPIFAALQPVALCDIEGLESIQVSREDEVTRRILLNLKDPDKEVSTCFLSITFQFTVLFYGCFMRILFS
jgi:hypothetical protein